MDYISRCRNSLKQTFSSGKALYAFIPIVLIFTVLSFVASIASIAFNLSWLPLDVLLIAQMLLPPLCIILAKTWRQGLKAFAITFLIIPFECIAIKSVVSLLDLVGGPNEPNQIFAELLSTSYGHASLIVPIAYLVLPLGLIAGFIRYITRGPRFGSQRPANT